MPEVRFLNLEYFFYKIYDFFGGIFGGGSSTVDIVTSSLAVLLLGSYC
jgi:hypothetical protein